MDEEVTIRAAKQADAPACAAIYAWYVTETAATFETEPPTAAEMARRIAAAEGSHAWFVAEDRGVLVGYAYAGPYKARPAYRWSCEVSVYVDDDHRGRGLGLALYEELFAKLAERGYRMVVAGMTLPNAASANLHRSLGFETVGCYRRIGFKHGRWHDVSWLQRPLGSQADPPAELR